MLSITTLVLSIIGFPPVHADEPAAGSRQTDSSVLAFYRRYGPFTDPGEYAALYKDLPASLPELCRLIKAQLIHPDADLPLYRGQVPAERGREDDKYPTVQAMLQGLLAYNSAGLILDRPPAQRLILSCRYHAILLASILKYRGVPARVRYGFATYLYPDYHIYHVVCEVWHEAEGRWMLVDPDRQKIDFPREEFQSAGEAWGEYRLGKNPPQTYGVIGWWGGHPILSTLCHDLGAVLGAEELYWHHPPVCRDPDMDMVNIPDDQLAVLNRVAVLLEDPDGNLRELKAAYDKYAFLRFEI